MAIIKWEPFDDLEKIFNGFFSDAPLRLFKSGPGWDLAVDVYEKGNNVIAEMNLPGIDSDKVNITINGDYLIISGSREEKKEEKNENKYYYSKEIKRGFFKRIVKIPFDIKSDEAKAEYKDGVLRVVLPKEKLIETKKIKIQKK